MSHTAKQEKPAAKVVFNDYDDYLSRLAAIPQTNKLLADLRLILKGYPKDKRILGSLREKVLERVASEVGFVDYITLSSSLLFSMNYVKDYEGLQKQSLYNCVRMSDYSAVDYLKGVEVVRKDYKALFARYCSEPSVIFLIDPPYLSTDASSYNSDGYWKMGDYLDVLDTLSGNYFYFTSNKSSIIELCDWVSNKTGGLNPFEGAVKQEVNTTMGYNSSYTDIMLYKYV